MAAVFSRAGQKSLFWKNLLPFSPKRCITVESYQNSPSRWITKYKKCNDRKSTSLLYSRSSSLFLSARYYSDKTGGAMGATDNITSENPFMTDILSSSDVLSNAGHTLNSLGEPTLASLGLGGWSPIGIVQQGLELIHTSYYLPWGWSIVLGTLCFRMLLFPLMAKNIANMTRLNNIKPEADKLQNRLREITGKKRTEETLETVQKLKQLYKDNRCHPMRSFPPVLIQLVGFMSFFFGLRRMVDLPVESLKTGGMLWFPDLTACDPYFILPIGCCLSMIASVSIGGEFDNTPSLKKIMIGACVIFVPMTAFFSTSILLFWITSNIFTLAQVLVLKTKVVRQIYGIPEMKVWETHGYKGDFFKDAFEAFKDTQDAIKYQRNKTTRDNEARALGKAPLDPEYKNNHQIEKNQELFSSDNHSDGEEPKEKK